MLNPSRQALLLACLTCIAGVQADTTTPPPHQSSVDRAGQHASHPYDLQFLDTMSHHHKGAIDMARLAENQAHSPAVKALARSIISQQQQEIDQFRQWRQNWYPGMAPALNMRMPGMMHGMKNMERDMAALQQARATAFDRRFLQLMIPHHQGAIDMSRPALEKLQHQELRDAAQKIIDDQTREIAHMRELLSQLPR